MVNVVLRLEPGGGSWGLMWISPVDICSDGGFLNAICFSFIFHFVFTLGPSGSPAGSEDQSLLFQLQAFSPGKEGHPGWPSKWEAPSKAPVHHPGDGSFLFLPAHAELPAVSKSPVLPGNRWSALCLPVGPRFPTRLPAAGHLAHSHTQYAVCCLDCHCHQAGPGRYRDGTEAKAAACHL